MDPSPGILSRDTQTSLSPPLPVHLGDTKMFPSQLRSPPCPWSALRPPRGHAPPMRSPGSIRVRRLTVHSWLHWMWKSIGSILSPRRMTELLKLSPRSKTLSAKAPRGGRKLLPVVSMLSFFQPVAIDEGGNTERLLCFHAQPTLHRNGLVCITVDPTLISLLVSSSTLPSLMNNTQYPEAPAYSQPAMGTSV